LPSYLYTINVKTLNSSKDLIKILMIDTIKLCGNTATDLLKGFKLDGQTKFQTEFDANYSISYLEMIEQAMKEINESSVPYFLVSGHYPVRDLPHIKY
jgi:hypothetical protein